MLRKIWSILLPSYKMSAGNTFATIGIIMAAISLAKLIIDFNNLPMALFMENIFKTYVVVFHTIFDVVFFWLPFHVPGYIKDICIFYAIIGGAAQRAELITVQADYRHPWIIMHAYKNSKIKFALFAIARLLWATLAWPTWTYRHASQPHLVMADGAHGPARIGYSSTPYAAGSRYGKGYYYGDIRIIMLMRLIFIIFGAALIIVANYAFSI